MTINYDGFAIIPHYCDDCKRRFVFEFYRKFNVPAIYNYNTYAYKCQNCVKKTNTI